MNDQNSVSKPCTGVLLYVACTIRHICGMFPVKQVDTVIQANIPNLGMYLAMSGHRLREKHPKVNRIIPSLRCQDDVLVVIVLFPK